MLLTVMYSTMETHNSMVTTHSYWPVRDPHSSEYKEGYKRHLYAHTCIMRLIAPWQLLLCFHLCTALLWLSKEVHTINMAMRLITAPRYYLSPLTSGLVFITCWECTVGGWETPPHPTSAPSSSAICCWTAPLWQRIGITSSEHDVGGVQR